MIQYTPFILLLLGSILFADRAGERKSPLGKPFPSVSGNALSGERLAIPESLSGSPAVLLVAYRRGTQEDIDRWIGLLQAEAPDVRFLEVPTIANPAWRPMASWIDSGMRGGVPREMWSRVVTLYRDAGVVRDFLGDSGGHGTHVVLLGGEGRVSWFDAAGYSDASAAGLLAALKALEGNEPTEKETVHGD